MFTNFFLCTNYLNILFVICESPNTNYSKLINSNPDWEMCGIYIDEAKTGTKDTREKFRRLISDCRKGLIDLVITKSVSRFARNTVDLLSTCRELREYGVDVFFENQNIHSVSSEGELMLTLLASIVCPPRKNRQKTYAKNRMKRMTNII